MPCRRAGHALWRKNQRARENSASHTAIHCLLKMSDNARPQFSSGSPIGPRRPQRRILFIPKESHSCCSMRQFHNPRIATAFPHYTPHPHASPQMRLIMSLLQFRARFTAIPPENQYLSVLPFFFAKPHFQHFISPRELSACFRIAPLGATQIGSFKSQINPNIRPRLSADPVSPFSSAAGGLASRAFLRNHSPRITPDGPRQVVAPVNIKNC